MSIVKKILAGVSVVGLLGLAACGSDDGETVVVQPPPQDSGTVVVPERSEPRNYIVPDSDGDGVKVCPEGSVC